MKYLSLLFLLTVTLVNAQTIENFSAPNAADGKPVSLNEYSTKAGVVIIFTSNTCPFDQYYLDRVLAIADTYTQRIPVLLINSHSDATESIETMKAYAQKCNITIPYLADKNQAIANQFNARKSPEALVLKNLAGKFTVVYRGAIDDNAQSASEVKTPFLKDAIDKMLAGEKIDTNDVRPVGCSIRRN
jgi:peroxiredoxin